MARTGDRFLISDTHFGHKGVCVFTGPDNVKPLRPWDTPEEMDEAMVELWNETVKEQDVVYHLGDVVINRRCLPILERLNGSKVLIKGNHDIFKLKDYLPYFRDIRGYNVVNGLIYSHIPVHEDHLGRFGCNVHGHLHGNRVMKDDAIDPRYFSVCVEDIDYRPMHVDEVRRRIVEQGGVIEMKHGNY